MSAVRGTCTECRNEMQLSPYEVFAVTFPNGRHQYHYECLLCGQLNIQWLGDGSLADLVRCGVVELVVGHPAELDEPHSGPNINLDNVTEWMRVINDPDRFWADLEQSQ